MSLGVMDWTAAAAAAAAASCSCRSCQLLLPGCSSCSWLPQLLDSVDGYRVRAPRSSCSVVLSVVLLRGALRVVTAPCGGCSVVVVVWCCAVSCDVIRGCCCHMLVRRRCSTDVPLGLSCAMHGPMDEARPLACVESALCVRVRACRLFRSDRCERCLRVCRVSLSGRAGVWEARREAARLGRDRHLAAACGVCAHER